MPTSGQLYVGFSPFSPGGLSKIFGKLDGPSPTRRVERESFHNPGRGGAGDDDPWRPLSQGLSAKMSAPTDAPAMQSIHNTLRTYPGGDGTRRPGMVWGEMGVNPARLKSSVRLHAMACLDHSENEAQPYKRPAG